MHLYLSISVVWIKIIKKGDSPTLQKCMIFELSLPFPLLHFHFTKPHTHFVYPFFPIVNHVKVSLLHHISNHSFNSCNWPWSWRCLWRGKPNTCNLPPPLLLLNSPPTLYLQQEVAKSSDRAIVLLRKNIIDNEGGNYIVDGMKFTVEYTVYNVGNLGARDITIEDKWDEKSVKLLTGNK